MSSNRPHRALLPILLVLVATAYFAAARLGLSMAYIAPQVSAVWPPTAVALAALLLGGRRLWPGVWVGAFVANVAAQAPWPVALGIACGNTLEALLAAWGLRRAGFDTSLERLRDVVWLSIAAALAPLVSATVGVGSLVLGHVQPAAAFAPLWLTWWLGDAMSGLLFAPPLLVWGTRLPQAPKVRRPVEAALLLSTLAAVCYVEFGDRFASVAVHYSLAYLVFPFMLAVALRVGQPMTTLAILGTALLAIRGTTHGSGPFSAGSPHLNLVLLQAFLAVLALTGLLLAAAAAERDTESRRRAADYGVTLALAESINLEQATPRIAQSVCESLDWDVGLLWTIDERAGGLRMVELWHRPEVMLTRFVAISRQLTLGPGTGLPGRVWAGARPAWIPDVLKDPNFSRADAAAADGLHGAFGFPILLQHEVLGVIEFFSRQIRKPDETLLRMFSVLGAQVGQFIDRCRAEEERMLLLARERTAREQAERALSQLQEAEAELLRSAEAKDQFLALLGHELRNPLAPLRNALEVVRARVQGDPLTEGAHRMMQRQLTHMVRLVDDLLDVARITRGKIELRKERVDLAALAGQAAESSRAMIDERGCSLVLSLPAEPVTLDADPTRIEQVVSNLLNNAGKYSEAGHRISLTVGREGDEGVLTVADEGIGIEPHMLERVFDLFVQADRVSGRVSEGLGMGLTLVRSLVEQHGGRVAVASAGRDAGSAFTVHLPLAAGDAGGHDAAAAAARTPAEAPAARRRVLVVDDNVDGAESLGLLLRLEGHEVRLAHDGASALATAEQYRPDVVLLDIGLPDGMDGYEVARRLRADLGLDQALLLALTGFGQAEDRRRAHEAGFDDHLVKPVEPARLKRLLSER